MAEYIVAYSTAMAIAIAAISSAIASTTASAIENLEVWCLQLGLETSKVLFNWIISM
ncbi:hypothetical protein GGS21DRAFT_494097 [Xylaria nigripes]|nr:hypothetical protein GGS21DRAFT_494097 [Xylaria nigripes]